MRRRIALAGSIAIHVAYGLLLAVRSPDDRAIEHPAIEIAKTVEVIEVAELVDDRTGGGTPGRSTAAPATPTRVLLAGRDRRPHRVSSVPAVRSLADALSDLATGSEDRFLDGASAGDGGTGGGRGGGRGLGLGNGNGLGDRTGFDELPPRPPPAPKASRARPAKLVYPTREREASEGELYLARVTVDADGYVVGARLVKGTGSPKDGDASSMIFRFRYLPALDEDGRPIESTVEQPFLVQ